MKYQCPVCLTNSLDEPYKAYSYDICYRCGVEYGYDDAIDERGLSKGDFWGEHATALVAEKHAKLRQIWVDAGRPDWWEETQRPDFAGGVRWFNDYWKKHQLEYEEWQDNLVSGFNLDKNE